MSTQEEVIAAWHKRWGEDTNPRPYCYNRADYPSVWMVGCPHWKPGGNARVLPKFNNSKGEMLSWTRCSGCCQKKS